MNRENDKWGRGLCFTGMMLNYIQSCHLEPIVLPECWQTSAQCVDCIPPFSFLICFSSPILKVIQHNHSEPVIISPVISLFFFCGKALIKHLIASTSQKCVVPTETQKSIQLVPEDLSLLSATAAEKRALFQTRPPPPLFSSLSSVCWKIRSPFPNHNDRKCKDVFCHVHCVKTLSRTVGYCSPPLWKLL